MCSVVLRLTRKPSLGCFSFSAMCSWQSPQMCRSHKVRDCQGVEWVGNRPLGGHSQLEATWDNLLAQCKTKLLAARGTLERAETTRSKRKLLGAERREIFLPSARGDERPSGFPTLHTFLGRGGPRRRRRLAANSDGVRARNQNTIQSTRAPRTLTKNALSQGSMRRLSECNTDTTRHSQLERCVVQECSQKQPPHPQPTSLTCASRAHWTVDTA